MYTDYQLKSLRQELRKNSTRAEIVLWNCLKGKQLGVKFRRQHSIGRNILDFYCCSLRLNIELDGKSHENQQEYDINRDNYLHAMSIKVIRIPNEKVINDIHNVIQQIKTKISELESPLLY